MYKRKTIDEYQVHGNFGYGWECLTCADNLKEARGYLRDYRENQPEGSFKLVTRRYRKDIEDSNVFNQTDKTPLKFIDNLLLTGKAVKTNIGAFFTTCFESFNGNLVFNTKNGSPNVKQPASFEVTFKDKQLYSGTDYSEALKVFACKYKNEE